MTTSLENSDFFELLGWTVIQRISRSRSSHYSACEMGPTVDSRGFCERVLARCLARSDSVKSAPHDSLHNFTDLTNLRKRDSTRLY